MKKERTSLIRNDSFQTLLASLICILGGLLVGYVVLLIIEPSGAFGAIVAIMKSFFRFPGKLMYKYLGQTLVRTVPLLMCALSVLFAYKVGMFNIGAAGQYVAGACACLYGALAWNLPWYLCLILGMVAGGLLGAISGLLKTMCNVNVVISGIMLNWISLYTVNMVLSGVKEQASPYTVSVASTNPSALLPQLGLGSLFSNNKYVTIAIPLSIIIAIIIWVIQTKTVIGYELQATGLNKDAAKYCGMKEKKNIVLTLVIGGALAALGAAFLFLSGFEQWSCTQSSVPAMGFNGIAATFLGALNPIGTIFASYFIQHITSGGAYLDKVVYPSQISDLISAIIIYLCAFVLFFKYAINLRLRVRQDRAAEAARAAAEKADKAEGGDAK